MACLYSIACRPAANPFAGRISASPSRLRFAIGKRWEFSTTAIKSSRVNSSLNQADFLFDAAFKGKPALTVIGLEGNSRVEQDWEAKVTVDGVEVARFGNLLAARCRTHRFRCAHRTRALLAVASELVGCEHAAVALSAERPGRRRCHSRPRACPSTGDGLRGRQCGEKESFRQLATSRKKRTGHPASRLPLQASRSHPWRLKNPPSIG
jgi:hypothetical protein